MSPLLPISNAGFRCINNKNGTIILKSSGVLHVPGLRFEGLVGYSPIAMVKNAIDLAIATEEYGAKFFANGATPGGILEYPGTVKNPEAVRESWAKGFSGNNSHKVAVIFKQSFLVIFKLPLSSIRISMHFNRIYVSYIMTMC